MYKLEFLQQHLLLIRENISNGYFPVSLDFLSIFVIFCGLVIIISKNPAVGACAPGKSLFLFYCGKNCQTPGTP